MGMTTGTGFARRASLLPFSLLCCATGAALAIAGCGAAAPPAHPAGSSSPRASASVPAGPRPSKPPAVSGTGVRALWQGAPWAYVTVTGGLVVGASLRDRQVTIGAVSALTGEPAWATEIPKSYPFILDIVAGPGMVIAEVGHLNGHPPLAVVPVVKRNFALDLRTGRVLWTAPVPGKYQAPPLAAAGSVIVSGAASGVITARQAASGAIAWTRPRPAGCTAMGVQSPVDDGMSLAGSGALLAASFECRGGHDLVQRLDPATGRVLWQWTTPRTSEPFLAATATAAQGSVVLLTGEIAPPSAARAFAGKLPGRYLWPASLGPLDEVQVVLALDASTGRPRWTELGGQLDNFTLADGAVCESANTGFECRDDVTGKPTRPVEVTGQGGSSSPPFGSDGYAGISGTIAGVTVAGPGEQGQAPRLDVLPIRGGRPVAAVALDIGARAYHANYQTFVVAAGQVSGGTLLLLRRVDLPGYPLVALLVRSPH